MNFEKESTKREKSFDEIKTEMAGRGFVFAGQESLTKIRFTGERFVAEKFRTKEDIVQKYVNEYKDQVEIEVELIDVPNLTEGQQAVYVFIKKSEGGAVMKSQEDKYQKTIELYERLGKKYIEDTAGVDIRWFPDFVKLLPKGGRVLDIGCAGGRDSLKFVQKGFEITGIDLVDTFLKEARMNVPEAKFIKMDLLELKFPDNYFNAIWANAVLLHIEKKDIPEALKGFYRVLKAGGKLSIGVKRGKGERYKDERLSGGEKRFFAYFFKNELEKFVKEAGFKIIYSKIFPDELGRKDVKWIVIWAEK